MTERRTQELESALRSVAREVSYPATPDIRAGVIERLHRAPVSLADRRRPLFRYALAAAALLLLVLGASVALSPTARRAVAGWLGVDGITITFDGEPTPQAPVAENLDLGGRVTSEEARQAVDFGIAVPSELGDPDAYFVLRDVEGGEVSLVWEPQTGLPESAHTEVGAVLTQFLGDAEPGMLKKTAATGTEVVSVSVDGNPGFFIEGAPHLLVRGPSGGERDLPPRLAGNTLLWDTGEVTYRLEAEVGRARAIEIAESLHD